jgi:AcrR family transcriptional regulator
MNGENPRTRILEAAGPVFAEKGFQAATVRDICQRACVNAASVNYYFGDKETLYIETVRLARQLRARQFPLPERPFGTPPEVRLRDFIITLLHRVLAGNQVSWNTKLMMREVLHPTKACRALVEEYIRPQFEVLSGIVRELVPEDTSTAEVRKIGFSILGQCLYYRFANEVNKLLTPEQELETHFQTEQIADHVTRFSLAAIGRTSPISDSGPAADGDAATLIESPQH